MQESSVFFKKHGYEAFKKGHWREEPPRAVAMVFTNCERRGGCEVVRCGDGCPMAVGYGGCGCG
ncbi:hypothetical protein [Bartonella saheliensis]|uniref:hypothetical protein n=1 Tax=Bartonella saheliensis TaxID=1457016 RepID=UPI0011AAA214|nr:hypothetical protein [Bartonella saheliensis]